MVNILQELGVGKFSLAGFDGFDLDLDKTYYDIRLAGRKQGSRSNRKIKNDRLSACPRGPHSF